MVIKWIKSDIQLITVSLITIIFVLVIALAVALTVPESKKESKETDDIEQTVSFPAVSIPDEVFGSYQCEHVLSDFTDSYYENEEELIYSYASFPTIYCQGNENINQINDAIFQFVSSKSSVKEHEKILALEKYDRASMNAEGFIQFEFILRAESVVVKEKFISILFSYSRTVSLSEPSLEYYSLNFDLSSGEAVNFSDIIAKTENEAIDYIASIISQDISINPNIYYPNAQDELQYCIDLSSFYLTETGVEIYFNPETLTPSVYGIRNFLVPYDKIGYTN